MDYLLTSLLSYVLIYKYAAIAVVAFLSGLLLPLPANTLFMASGAFASQGYISAFAAFAVAAVSNVLGDSCGYALTRFWGTRFITEAHIRRFASVSRIERFVREHARPTILITRFLGTPGVVVNFLCGLSHVPYRRFVLYDAIGNALDASSFILAGYALGVYAEAFSDIAQTIGWIVFVAFLIFLAVRLFIRKAPESVV